MSRPEPHTIVRFKLRSLLAITLGVSLVMAVASSYVRTLKPEQQTKLFHSTAMLGMGATLAGIYYVHKRYRLGLKCGPLLLTLPMGIERNKSWYRWVFLLALVPYAIAQLSNYGNATVPQTTARLTLSATVAFCWGIFLVRFGLPAWVEGFSHALEFCENGILYEHQFYEYSSPQLRLLRIADYDRKLIINIQHHQNEIPIPKHQREAVEAVLEHYYEPSREAKNATNLDNTDLRT